MGNICINTTLMNCPKPKKHELIVITRGATAEFTFGLTNKVYTINEIKQMTFMFKQDKEIKWYNLVEYFKLTSDTVVVAGKTYYDRIPSNMYGVVTYKFIPLDLPVGTGITGYYERCDLADTETTENWQFNDHFAYNDNGEYQWISFRLTSAETKNLKLTDPQNNMQFEIAIELDTDALRGTHRRDSLVIEPQHPVAVVDSLFSQINTSVSSTTNLIATNLLR